MKEHVIRKGESLDTIAKEYKITVENIIKDNKIQDRDRLGVGNILEIREVAKMYSNGNIGGFLYVVKKMFTYNIYIFNYMLINSSNYENYSKQFKYCKKN